MIKTKQAPWIVAAMLLATLTSTMGLVQKSPSPDVLYQRAVQKEKVDGDTKAAVDLYKQVVVAPGVSQKLKSQAQERVTALGNTLSGSFADRLICQDNCPRGQVSITANGRFMAYTENENRDLEILDLETRRVTHPIGATGLTYAPWPLLSPDGRQVVYASTERDSDGRVIKQSLRVIPNEASGKSRALVDNPEYHEFIPGAWARNNKDVLVALSKPDETWLLAWVSIADGAVTPIKSLGWRFAPRMGRPSLSPDGRYIAYSALADAPSAAPSLSAPSRTGRPNSPNQSTSHVYVLAVDGAGPEIELVKGASINEAPVWMPDSKRVLFDSNRGGPFGLWSAALKDGKEATAPVLVKVGIGINQTLGTTNAGAYYYRMNQPQVAQFSVATINRGKSPDIGSGTTETIIGLSPVWSPDNKHIAFTRQTLRAAGPELESTLFVYSFDSADERRYSVSNSNPVGKPLWFHDGKALLQLMRVASGDTSLFLADLKGGEFRQVGRTVHSVPLAISSDDKTTYILVRGKTPAAGTVRMDLIVAVDINSGQQRDVSTVSEPDSMILSHDDKTLYMTSCGDRKCDRVTAVDVTSGQQRQILKVQDPELLYGPRLALSPDGHLLVAVTGTRGKSQELSPPFRLIQIGVDGSGYRKLTELNSQPGSLSWPNDGAMVAASRSQLIRVPVNGGNPEVTKLVPSRDVNISPDGSYMTIAASEENVVVIRAFDNVDTFLKTAK